MKFVTFCVILIYCKHATPFTLFSNGEIKDVNNFRLRRSDEDMNDDDTNTTSLITTNINGTETSKENINIVVSTDKNENFVFPISRLQSILTTVSILAPRVSDPKQNVTSSPHNSSVIPSVHDLKETITSPVHSSIFTPLVQDLNETSTSSPRNSSTLIPLVPDLQPATTLSTTETRENSTCHMECLSVLEQMTLKMTPNVSLLKQGSFLTLECSLPVYENSSIRMIWLFQGVNPPSSQCSLTHQETLPTCDSFASTDHFIDANISTGYLKEILILNDLMEKNSGYYYCMVELPCCLNSHIMDRSIGTEKPVQIYFEDYALELGVLIGSTAVLFILIGIGTFFQNRRRQTSYVSILTFENPNSGDVLHAPILEDEDSFDESDQEN